MIAAAVCLGAVLVVGVQAPTGVASADSVVTEARFARALADLQALRFTAAATELEALWREGGSPRALELAAEAREGAGHWLHAIEHVRLLLAADPALDDRQRARLTAKVAAARRHTAPVVVRLGSDGGPVGAATVTLRRVAPDEVRPPLTLPITDGRVIDVDPGVWSLTVEAAGFRPRQRVLTVPPRARRGEPVAEEAVFSLERAEVATALTLAPAAAVAAGAQWTLTFEEEGGGLRTIGGAGAREQLSLAPGRWRARVAAAGFVAHEFTFIAGAGDPPPVTLIAEAPPPAPAPPQPPRARDPGLGLGLGVGLTGGVTLGVGVGLLIQHAPAYRQFRRAPDNAGFVAAVTGSAVGSAMVGAGVGLGIAAVTAALPVRRDGRGIGNRGLWIELGVGGGVTAIAAGWYASEWRRVQRGLYGEGASDVSADVRAQRRETTAAAFLGAGVGLMAGAGAALLTRHLVRRADRLALAGGPGLVGLGVRGRF